MLENKKKVLTDPDFVNIRRFDYSLEKMLERYPEGASNRLIGSALMMTEEQVIAFYKDIVEKLKVMIGA